MKLREKVLVAFAIVFALLLAFALILGVDVLLKIAVTVFALAMTVYAVMHIVGCIADFTKTKICLAVVFAFLAAISIALSILTWCNVIFVMA
ncbi:MAG: hypothetical protein NC350_03370 [Corallococcus sp.]|nr:hypothetical protein [Corallococcus sp.]